MKRKLTDDEINRRTGCFILIFGVVIFWLCVILAIWIFH